MNVPTKIKITASDWMECERAWLALRSAAQWRHAAKIARLYHCPKAYQDYCRTMMGAFALEARTNVRAYVNRRALLAA